MTGPTPAKHARQTRSAADLLAGLEDAPLAEHPALFEQIHARLTQRLAATEQDT